MRKEFRIRESSKGFVVEVQERTWYGGENWTHLICYAGMDEKPFYYKTYTGAEEDLMKEIKWSLRKNSKLR